MTKLIALRSRIGRNIRALRKAQGWSQEALGEKADLSYKFVGEIERGLVNPSLDSLMKIADVFKVEVAELFMTERFYVLTDTEITNIKSAMTVLNNILGDISSHESS